MLTMRHLSDFAGARCAPSTHSAHTSTLSPVPLGARSTGQTFLRKTTMLERQNTTSSHIVVTEVSCLRFGYGLPFNILTHRTVPPRPQRVVSLNPSAVFASTGRGSHARSPKLFQNRGGNLLHTLITCIHFVNFSPLRDSFISLTAYTYT